MWIEQTCSGNADTLDFGQLFCFKQKKTYLLADVDSSSSVCSVTLSPWEWSVCVDYDHS